MKFFRTILFLAFALACNRGLSQTLGGVSAYNFLHLPATPLLTAAGGVNVSCQDGDVGMTSNNPALLDPTLNHQLALSFNSFIAGIKTYSVTGAHYQENWKTTLGGHIYFVDYGSIPQTDAAGNVNGEFRPVDYVVQVSASRNYLERWQYGLTMKFIHSGYQQYTSSALAFDAGVLYSDTANKFYASVLAKNMGGQLKTFNGEGEDLPFDLQIGITKRLAKAPFGFSFTAQHLQTFNIHYNDAVYNADNNVETNDGFGTRLLNHFVVASHIYLGNNLELTVGYNHLRRSELNSGTSGNGLNGFSTGVKIRFQKLQFMYARANYQRNVALNQFGLYLAMDKIL
jgi:hypothetical protein